MSGFPEQTKTPKIAVGINAYYNWQGLDQLLSNIHEHTDKQFIIHGKYKDFPLDFPGSLYKTIQVCEKYPKAQISECVNFTEIQKRNMYMELSKGYDFLMVVDPDEVIPPQICDWDEFKKNLYRAVFIAPRARIFDVFNEGPEVERVGRPRIFYKPQTIRYWGKHYWFVITDADNMAGKPGLLLKGCSDSGHIVHGIVMYHDHRINDHMYFDARQNYEVWIRNNENMVHSSLFVPPDML